MPRIASRPRLSRRTGAAAGGRRPGPRLRLLAVLAAALAAAAPAGAALEVFVSIPPQASIVEAIGGDHVAVRVLVSAGQDPHSFSPTPRQVVTLGGAALYFSLGLPFEATLLPRVAEAHAELEIIDMSAGIERRMIAAEHHHHAHAEHAEDHDHDHAHAHETDHHHGHADGTPPAHPDPHIWLSPPLLEQLARNTAAALAAADPQRRADYQENLEGYLRRVAGTHRKVAELLAPLHGAPLFVFHPAFGYFADTYGLNQVAVETEGKDPSPRELTALIKRAKQAGARVIFVQPQFDQKSALAIARSIDGAVVPLDPLARDVLANLETMAALVEGALRGD
jgi:zinc transport system substrate-binding protein